MKKNLTVWKNGYKFNKNIFRISLLIMVLLFILAWINEGGNIMEKKVYMSCPEKGSKCYNPLYKTCQESYCEQEYLMPGDEIGSKPKFLYNNFLAITIIVLIISFIINHYRHNKGFFKDGEVI